MNEYRSILVAFSVLCGCILFAFAIRHTVRIRQQQNTRRRAIVLWIYGGLFLAAALMLWKRNAHTVYMPSDSRQQALTTPSGSSSKTTDENNSATPARKSTALVPATQPDSYQESPIIPDSTLYVNENSYLSRRDFRLGNGRRTLNPYQLLPQNPSSGRPFEEVVYTAVSKTFDKIEKWFFEYGSESNTSTETVGRKKIRGADNNVENLPPIFFEPNTAELTAESASALREIAGLFKSQETLSVIEIRARTESTGPEPFNYILTQARAEVVRDFLTKEGINTDRLVARAMGAGSADSAALRSHISFVVQR